MVPVFLDMGLRVRLHGWERKAGERYAFAWPDGRVREQSILRGGGYVSRLARAMYPIWMVVVFFRALTLGRRKLLFCLGWESAFPALLAAKLTGSRVIFDDADRFSMLIRLPAPAHWLLVRLERWVSTGSAVHVVPGWSRYDFRHPGMKLLRNTPSTPDLERAKQIAPERPDADFVLYVNGWIGETRGASVFLALMRRLQTSASRTVMLAAGWTDCPAGNELFSLPNVQYKGELSTDAALALYHSCDLVLTYYDPAVAINRQAESNKWGDCILLGRQFVVNAEVETARSLIESGFGHAVPYHDIDALEQLVLTLARQRQDIPADNRMMDRTATKPPKDYQPFDSAIRDILADLIQEHETARIPSGTGQHRRAE